MRRTGSTGAWSPTPPRSEGGIRLATGRDSPAVAELVRVIYDEFGFPWDPGDSQADLYDLAGHYLAQGDGFWVGSVDGAVVGCIGLRCFPAVPGATGAVVTLAGERRIAGCDGALTRLYVSGHARRRGLGTGLLAAAVAEARRRRCRALELWSDKRLVDAHRLYDRLGARPVGERVIHDPDRCEEWGLILELADPGTGRSQ